MSSILHLRKQLACPPVALTVASVSVRTIVVPDDVDVWLELRERAMADLLPQVRRWSRHDFMAEIANKRAWLAIAGGLRVAGPSTRSFPAAASFVIGAVTLAMRHGRDRSVPVIHWLLVDPAWRRRGVGRMLVSRLERAAWDDGWREIELETHAGWSAAVAFYQSIGYAPPAAARDRSPR
jgi:GNAT superfamily N-acetyltransferase